VRVALAGRRNGHELTPDEVAEHAPAPPAAESDPALRAALRALPARRRLIVYLRYFADLSYAEIAAACEISEGTVAAVPRPIGTVVGHRESDAVERGLG